MTNKSIIEEVQVLEKMVRQSPEEMLGVNGFADAKFCTVCDNDDCAGNVCHADLYGCSGIPESDGDCVNCGHRIANE